MEESKFYILGCNNIFKEKEGSKEMEENQQEFLIGDWNKLKEGGFSLLANQKRKEELFKQIGYDIDEAGFLVDAETKEKVLAEDGKEINLKTDKKIALVSGTHTFVRNTAGYSQFLTDKGLLRIS